ncbi:MAG: hypothetical protein ACOC9W_04550 [Persicimonas sp.]
MKTRFIAVLAALLLVLTVSQTAFSQDDSAPAEAEQSSEESTDEASETDEQSAQEEADEVSEADEDSEAEAGDDEAGDDEAGDDEAGDDEAGDDEAEAEAGDDEPAKGPGGKPLRDDYPGTEDSKKASMDTDRIEGLSFDEGDTPEDGYDVRIRELETKVDDLKEKVFRSKSRIVLLKETVLSGNLSGSRAVVSHTNDLGGAYELRRAHYSLDGSRLLNETADDDSLDDQPEIELFNGSISPGNHRVSIMLELKGTGFGLFSYMDDYKFTIKDSCDFTAQEGNSSVVAIRLIDRGGALADYEERPGIECVVNSVKLSGDDLQPEADGDAADGDDEKASK